jgi:4-hydroxybenzoate polyprenyltransferase
MRSGEIAAMMGRALLIVGWLATLGLAVTAVIGYLLGSSVTALQPHLLLGLVACLLLLFSHSWVMFYLIGTGKAIKDAVHENHLETELSERTKSFKNRTYPWLMAAMGLAIATFVLGGGYVAGAVPSWIHVVLFYATLVVQVWALVLEGRVLLQNERLMNEINQRLA